ncbi:baseplate J/gp47 family protein [Parasulfitobacter algicola]|uniref:Baseplate J/gp47 family protein n=1 Tax=Parasulfitobacter algicola TaxID=2614809 RepID=A0ABX2IS70_9RHOB|nr:baseplate J/gp47 family protein [Sulfitobacter algicola]NSX55754.1 baseplate J/gp47 family protein [Sulfitobacter algicola]
MTLQSPNLDDRTYDDLVQSAHDQIKALCPEWTDFGPSDPGRTLVETFAFLTEVLIWRVNRLPEKAYVEFLNSMGVVMGPPAAASTILTFTRTDTAKPMILPTGTVIGASKAGGRGEAITFNTLGPARFEAGVESVQVRAANATLVEGELLGKSDGQPGQTFHVSKGPILAPLGVPMDLTIGVETPRDQVPTGAEAIEYEDAVYVLWSETKAFSESDKGKLVFTADRIRGQIRFAPAARLAKTPDDTGLSQAASLLAAVPPNGRRIRAWYRTGGGERGNVVANTLTKIDAMPGMAVTNPDTATGGRDAETLANALTRGPRDVASRGRAVTAQDYEALAERQSHVSRARAHARADIWKHADKGSVEVVLAPHLPVSKQQELLTRDILESACTDLGLKDANEALQAQRPLGARCDARWVQFKPVRIRVRAALRPYENATEVSARLQKALNEMISPFPDAKTGRGAWTFGEPLRSWHINDVARREPAIEYLEDPIIETPEAPDDVCSAITADHSQKGVWYAGSEDKIYRSLNDGDGWELAAHFPDETVRRVATPAAWHGVPEMLGLVAVITRTKKGNNFYISRDCGDSWQLVLRFEEGISVDDLDFLMRDDGPTVLFAAEDGLREFTLDRDKNWRRITIDSKMQDRRVWALTVARNPVGSASRYTVFAAGDGRGLFYSATDGMPGSFIPIGPAGMEDQLFRALETHEFGGQARVWAGVRVAQGVKGKGCFEYRVTGRTDDAPRVRPYPKGWNGESCRGIAFMEDKVLVATHRGGVQMISLTDPDPEWRRSDVNCGLPQRRLDLLQPINVIAATDTKAMICPGQEEDGQGGGVYRTDDGASFARCSNREHVGFVTLPPNWLFCCAGEHVIDEVRHER